MTSPDGASRGLFLRDGLRYRLANPAADLLHLRPAVSRFLLARGASDEARSAVDVVLEEIVAGVMNHSGSDDRPRTLEMHIMVDRQRAILRFEDDGQGLDPTISRPRGAMGRSGETPVGSPGLAKVWHLLEEVDCRRVAGRNRLRLAIPLLPR